MNTINFEVKTKSLDDHSFKYVDIFIDGINLIVLLEKYELPFAQKEGSSDIAGGYAGIDPKSLYLQLTRDIKEGWPEGKRNIYSCKGCLEEGCWPMYMETTEENNLVTWSKFEQPYRGKNSKSSYWNYSGFLPLIFESKDYWKAVESLIEEK